ncbi:MAM domain-containing glycosylphosphatidylinositol anchor protein 1 isoform X1, partial [Tachysurus ichikawai]
LDKPMLTVHQTISDVRGNYYQEKTVFLRCTVNSNPPARFIWKRGNVPIEQSKDNGVDIYEPLYTQVHHIPFPFCFPAKFQRSRDWLRIHHDPDQDKVNADDG